MKRALLVMLVACGSPAVKPVVQAPAPKPAVATAPVKPAPAEPFAARVDGATITIADVDHRMAADIKRDLDAVADPSAREYFRAQERVKVLAELVEEQLLRVAARRADYKVEEDQIDRAIDAVRTANNLTEEQLVEALVAQGKTSAWYREDIKVQLQIAFMLSTEFRGVPSDVARKQLLEKLRAAAKIEIALVEPQVSPTAPRFMDISPVLTKDDVERIVKHTLPPSEVRRMDSEPRTITYDSMHAKAEGPESNDYAVRVWREPLPALDKRWADLTKDLPNVKIVNKVADRSAAVTEGNIRAHMFLDRKATVVVMVQCGSGVCRTAAEALELAKHVHAHLDRITTSPATLR